MSNIVVVDSIMGSGKTSWSIQHINESISERFLYITPFLNEADRICENTRKTFYKPDYRYGSKLDSVNELLAQQVDIASTHELFKRMDENSKDFIAFGNYTLILDEVLSVIEPYDNIRNDDMKLLKDSGCITIDENGFVIWNKEKANYDTRYNEIKVLAENQSLIYVNKKLLLWRYPPEIFSLFDKIYILTYMFDASILKAYFDLHRIEYERKSIIKEEDEYKLTDYFIPDTEKYKELIHIYDGKLNENLPQKINCLSKTWYTSKSNGDHIKKLKNNLYNYFANIQRAKNDSITWTTFADYKNKLQGKGYTKGFIACNCRSTNKYGNRYNLAFCVNVYLHPGVSQFFKQKGITINEELYALSEMIQWIWRSRIRNGEEISIYIPSSRMRNLLVDWLNMELDYQDKNAA